MGISVFRFLWWDRLGVVVVVGFREGVWVKVRFMFFYFKVGFIFDVGKCFRVFIVDGKGICGVRFMWIIR